MNSDTISEFKWIKDITIKTESFATDQLNNIYSIDKTGVVKISIEDQSRFSYSSKLNGNIHSVDVTDPFRILIFYKDFSRAVFLDNKLTELLSAIQLNDLGYFNVQAVGTSSRGGFWIYDQDVAQIVYIDKSLKESHRSSVLRDIIDKSSDKEMIEFLKSKSNSSNPTINTIFNSIKTTISTAVNKISSFFSNLFKKRGLFRS